MGCPLSTDRRVRQRGRVGDGVALLFVRGNHSRLDDRVADGDRVPCLAGFPFTLMNALLHS